MYAPIVWILDLGKIILWNLPLIRTKDSLSIHMIGFLINLADIPAFIDSPKHFEQNIHSVPFKNFLFWWNTIIYDFFAFLNAQSKSLFLFPISGCCLEKKISQEQKEFQSFLYKDMLIFVLNYWQVNFNQDKKSC